jgi:transposase InsO family protein
VSPQQFADHLPDQAQLTTRDNALAETINGLYKTELIRPRKPWRTIDEVELATAEWVDW